MSEKSTWIYSIALCVKLITSLILSLTVARMDRDVIKERQEQAWAQLITIIVISADIVNYCCWVLGVGGVCFGFFVCFFS